MRWMVVRQPRSKAALVDRGLPLLITSKRLWGLAFFFSSGGVCSHGCPHVPSEMPVAVLDDSDERYYLLPRPNMRPNRSAIDLAGLMSTRVDPSGSGRFAACSAESVVQTQLAKIEPV